ncbi:MAG: GGDEF domain-containing protein, partial [Oscillospiraceae bacterium]
LIWASATMRLMKETVTGDLYAYGTVRSINEQKTIELALQQRAEKDPLTNAYSQDTALKIMTDALLLEKNGQSGYALLAFDIDNFSQLINQSGYMTAESVLTELSDLLRLKFGSTQIMGRFYDDELVLLLGDHPLPNPVRETAEGICRSMAQPYMFSAAKIPVRVSVGIAFGLANEGLQVLYGRARIALGVAKSSEKTHCVLYQDTTHDADLPRTEAPLGPASLSLLGDAQSVLLRCVFLLTEAADLPSAVVPTLTELAAFYAADRAYLLLPKERFAAPCDFYEWKKENVLSKRELPTLLFQPDALLKSDEAPLLKQRLMLDDISIIRSVWPQAHERLLRQG